MSLQAILISYREVYTKLFEAGCCIIYSDSKGWHVSQKRVSTKERKKYFESLATKLLQENCTNIEFIKVFNTKSCEKLEKTLPKPAFFPGLDIRVSTIIWEYAEVELLFSSKKTYACLSNFFPTLIVHNGRLYPTAEHLYQNLKVRKTCYSEEVFLEGSALKVKRWANTQRKEFPKPMKQIKYDKTRKKIMIKVARKKFSQNPALNRILRDTFGMLREDTNDGFWGGEKNYMGKVLQKVRKELKS